MFKQIKEELIKALSALKNEQFADTPQELSENEVKISERKVGGKVELIGADEKLSDAPDGSYKVGDFVFTVKEGVIDSIEGEEPKEEELADEQVTEDKPAKDNSTQEAIAALQAETESIKKDIETIKNMLSEFAGKSDVSEFKNEVVKLNKTIQKLAKLPAEPTKTNFTGIVEDDKEKKITDFLNILKK